MNSTIGSDPSMQPKNDKMFVTGSRKVPPYTFIGVIRNVEAQELR